VCDDIAHDPRAVLWSDAALQRDYRTMGAFPLKVGGRVIGTYNIYATETGFFDAEEVRLLDDYRRLTRAQVTIPRSLPLAYFPGCLSLMKNLPPEAFRNFRDVAR
jgi:hypothetical protein